MDKHITLIVGINGSIGRACKVYFESRGHEVIGTSRSKKTDKILELDITDLNSIHELNIEGTIKNIIITTGYEPQLNLKQTSLEHIERMFMTHVKGPMLLIQHLYPKLSNGGAIIFLSSPAAKKGSYDPAYAAAKGATESLVKTLAKELAPSIRVNAVSPSLIFDSPVYNRMTEDFRQKHLNNTLTLKHTTAEECASLIYFVCETPQITGQILQINGGMI